MFKLLFVLFCTACIAACDNAPGEVTPPTKPEQPTDTAPGYSTARKIIDQMADRGYLGARAVVSSGIYAAISENEYPFLLMVFGSNSILEAYLSEQGLLEEEFLEHPKLRGFIEQHLIDSYVDTVKIRSTQNTEVTHISAAGSEVIFTTGSNLDPMKGDVMFANEVPVEAYCSYSGNGGDGQLQVEAQICFMDDPIVEFDWSNP